MEYLYPGSTMRSKQNDGNNKLNPRPKTAPVGMRMNNAKRLIFFSNLADMKLC